MQLLLMEDQQVVKALSSHTAQKAFTDGIGAFRVIGCFQDLDAAGLGNPREGHAKLAIVIPDEIRAAPHQRPWLPAAVGPSMRQWESVSHRRGSRGRECSSMMKKA